MCRRFFLLPVMVLGGSRGEQNGPLPLGNSVRLMETPSSLAQEDEAPRVHISSGHPAGHLWPRPESDAIDFYSHSIGQNLSHRATPDYKEGWEMQLAVHLGRLAHDIFMLYIFIYFKKPLNGVNTFDVQQGISQSLHSSLFSELQCLTFFCFIPLSLTFSILHFLTCVIVCLCTKERLQ